MSNCGGYKFKKLRNMGINHVDTSVNGALDHIEGSCDCNSLRLLIALGLTGYCL